MSNAVALNLSVTADTGDAAAAFDKVGQSAKDMANDVDAAARDADSGMSGFGDSAENAGSSAQTAAGAFGDLGGALAMMPGPLGKLGAGMETAAPAIQGVTGATDLLGLAMNSQIITTIRQTAVTVASTVAQKTASAATKIWAATQWALNAAMSANPIGLIVAAIALLVAGIILAYKKSDTFRGIVQKLGATAKTVFTNIVTWITKVVNWVRDKLGPVFTGYATIVKTQIKIVVTVIKGIYDTIKWLVDQAKTKLDAVWKKIKDVFGWNPGPTLSKAWDGVKDILTKPFTDAWDAITKIFGAGGSITSIGDAAISALTTAANKLIDIVNKLISAFNKLPGPNIPSVPHISSSAAGVSGTSARAMGYGYAAPMVGSTRTVNGAAVAGGVVINVYGAVDAYGTAQAIRRVLARGALISGRRTP